MDDEVLLVPVDKRAIVQTVSERAVCEEFDTVLVDSELGDYLARIGDKICSVLYRQAVLFQPFLERVGAREDTIPLPRSKR